MMKSIHVYALLLVLFFHNSCVQSPTNVPTGNSKSEAKVIAPGSNEQNIYTQYDYADSNGKRMMIQNGYPRGGIKYTDPNGNAYSYAVFWSRIINETDNPLELKIDFPSNAYAVSNFPGKYFKVLVPADTMTLDKFPLPNYGLVDLPSFLDNHLHQPSSLKRTVNPKEMTGFYFVMLILTEAATGMTRTGLSLKGLDLFYKISRYSVTKPISLIEEKEIYCGSINVNLK